MGRHRNMNLVAMGRSGAQTQGRGVNVLVGTANATLVMRDATFQVMTPTATRNVTLPAEAKSKQRWFCFENLAAIGSGFNMVIKTPGGATLATVRPGASCEVACDGTTWSVQSAGFNSNNLIDRVPVEYQFNASSPTGQWVFVCDRAYTVQSIKEIHAVAGSDGGAVTAQVRKVTADGNAPDAAAGANVVELILAPSTINLKAAINTTQSAALNTVAGSISLAAGDRIGLKLAGTLTALAGASIILELSGA